LTVDNGPRPYSTLRDGKIIWVVPEVNQLGPKKRSRLETDDEVRARIKAGWRAWTYWDPVPDLRKYGSKELDNLLKVKGLEPRKVVDEVV
jgi:hypothetical protein